MGGMKTLGATLIGLALAAPAAGADGLPRSPSQRVELFETCAGRLSAQIEHLWLFDGAAADRVAARRDEFDQLIEAVLPDALDWGMPQTLAMDWRIRAKAAQAGLLSTAAFDLDPRAPGTRRQPCRRAAGPNATGC